MPNWKYIKYGLEERLEVITDRLKTLREWLNQLNPKVMIGITVVLILIFIMVVISQFGDGQQVKVKAQNKAWFYDLNTGEIFTADSDKLPPIKAPSGLLANGEPAGVRAYLLSYVNEPNESERFIGFLEKLTEEGQKLAASFQKSRDNVTRESIKRWNQERLIRRIDDKEWFSVDSEEGKVILKEIFQPDENGRVPHYYSLE